jgi:hypothetical protein
MNHGNRWLHKNRTLLTHILSISLINCLLYLFITLFHAKLPFNTYNYTNNAHHFLTGNRSEGKPFTLLRALGQYDAQWYLKIAQNGYPQHPISDAMSDKKHMDGLSYAFFPLYPLVLSGINIFFKNIELSAFLLSNGLFIINILLLFSLTKKISSEKTAIKTMYLIFLFPFSIFFRSYFTEGLYLSLLLLFAQFLLEKKYIPATFALSLLNITKANGWLLNGVLLYFIWSSYRKKQLPGKVAILLLALLILPTFLWMTFCYIQTGNPLYFLTIRSAWSSYGMFAILHNFQTLLQFPQLPIHDFHASQIDTFCMFIIGILLIVSRKHLPPALWWISFSLWLSPLLVTDTMSFTRYQIVSFPIFYYLAITLNKKYYFSILSLFTAGLLFFSLGFVNWYWIG